MRRKRGSKAAVWILCAVLAAGLAGCRHEDSETVPQQVPGGIENIMNDPNEAVGTETGEQPADVTPAETTALGEGQSEVPEQTAGQMPEQSEEPTPAAGTPELNFDVDTGRFAGLSNEVKPWGPGTEVDGENRPAGATLYQDRYGSYDADFIRESSQKIYLTLDEGYENGYTGAILDVLREKQVSAVFFVTMPYVKAEPELIRRMIDEGHVVGAHSVTHPADGMPSLSLEEQLTELRDLHAYVKQEFGYEMYLFRYPAGIFSEQSLALVQATGYRSVFWSFAYRDWVTDDQPDPAAALDKVVSRLHPGAIYLLHAVSSTNTQIMGEFIDQARAAGYEFARYEAE